MYHKINSRLLIAISLIAVSNLGWLIPLIIVPFLHESFENKGLFVLFWIIFGQVTYNVGLLIAGVDLIKKLKHKGIKLKNISIQLKLLSTKLRKITKKLKL